MVEELVPFYLMQAMGAFNLECDVHVVKFLEEKFIKSNDIIYTIINAKHSISAWLVDCS